MRTGRPHVQLTFADPVDEEPDQPPAVAMRSRWRTEIVLLILLATLPYLASLAHGFGIADDVNVTQNPLLRGHGAAMLQIWRHPSILPHFEPLAYTLFMGQYHLFAGAKHLAGTCHLLNILLHAANVLLLWRVLRALRVGGATVAAGLFAVHPVVAGTVCWISAQPLLLCGVFLLASLLLSLRYLLDDASRREDTASPPSDLWRCYLPAMLLFGAALTSNIAAMTLPLVLLIILWWQRPQHRIVPARAIAMIGPMVLLSLACAWITWVADHRRMGLPGYAEHATAISGLEHLSLAPRIVCGYAAHVLLPVRWPFMYPTGTGSGLLIQLLPPALILAALGVAWALRRRVGRGPLASGLLFLAVCIPSPGLFRTDVQPGSNLGDSLAYFPAAVLIGAAVAAIHAMVIARSRRQWLARSLAVAGAVALLLLSLARLPDYRDSESMWRSTLRLDPSSIAANNALGQIELTTRHNPAGAMEYFRRALSADSRDVSTLLNIASIYRQQNEPDKQIMQYYQVLADHPDNADARCGLADALARQGHSSEAIAEYEKVLHRDPGHLQALNELGLLHADRGEVEQAMKCYHDAIDRDPHFSPPYFNLANLLFQQGLARNEPDLVAQASKTLRHCLEIDPNNFEVFLNAGYMVAQYNDNEQAERFFRAAVRLRPDSSPACANLGIVLAREQKLDEAIYYLQRAIELDPQNAQAIVSLENARRAKAQQRQTIQP